MKDVEDLLNQIIEQSGDTDAQWLWGMECSSETEPGWKATVKFTKAGVGPVVMAARTKRGLKKELQRYLDGEEVKDINIRYCQAQIELEQQAIRFYENLINDYESPPSELPTE